MNVLGAKIKKNRVEQTGVNKSFEKRMDDLTNQLDDFKVKFAGTSFEDSMIERFTNEFQKVFDRKMMDYKEQLTNKISSLNEKFEE